MSPNKSPLEKNAMGKWVQVQGKMSSHILKKSPIALTYSRIVEGVTE